jgi:hypothetical protein
MSLFMRLFMSAPGVAVAIIWGMGNGALGIGHWAWETELNQHFLVLEYQIA